MITKASIHLLAQMPSPVLAAFSKPEEFKNLMGIAGWVIAVGAFPGGVWMVINGFKELDREGTGWMKIIGGLGCAAALPIMGYFYVAAGMDSANAGSGHY